MLFKEYVEQINKYVEEHPETLEFNLLFNNVSYPDDYIDIAFNPKIGYLEYFDEDKVSDGGMLIEEKLFKEYNERYEEDCCVINSICLNNYEK
jgi:hypothetical protein